MPQNWNGLSSGFSFREDSCEYQWLWAEHEYPSSHRKNEFIFPLTFYSVMALSGLDGTLMREIFFFQSRDSNGFKDTPRNNVLAAVFPSIVLPSQVNHH